MSDKPHVDAFLASLNLPVAGVDVRREPELRLRLGALAAEAEALAREYPGHAAELVFIAGYIRRVLSA